MHIHILGICGTFMGSLALLARAMGHKVTGSDENVYPPMSTQLENAGITIGQGFDPSQLQPEPDLVVIGNAMSRGNPAVEYVLNRNLPYASGPQWLGQHLLKDKWVLAVSGTHGKTTTTAMLAFILSFNNFKPGYLIGGVPQDFEASAALGESAFFVIEADEYDTAFFDKRAKFVHYHPRTLIINNLEFDHADIYSDLSAIQKQFHHVVRLVPGVGKVLKPFGVNAVDAVLAQGLWSDLESVGHHRSDSDWAFELIEPDGSAFNVYFKGEKKGRVNWAHSGLHNVHNGLMAIAAAHDVGVQIADALTALNQFKGVKRRMELLGRFGNVSVYDDFAHHPTAIDTTLKGLRAQVGEEAIVAVIEPRSNTMKMGVHNDSLPNSVSAASDVFWYQAPSLKFDLKPIAEKTAVASSLFTEHSVFIKKLLSYQKAAHPVHIVLMSNGGFDGLREKVTAAFAAQMKAGAV